MLMYDKFHAYLCDLEAHFTKLAELLLQKLAALEKFDVNKLDEIIKEEQVYVLISKGFDGNVKDYRDKLSLKGEKLSDIIEELPEDQAPRFRLTFQKLKAALAEADTLNQRCQGLIEERLHIIDKALKEIDVTASSYKKGDGSDPTKTSDGGPRLLSKSI